MCRTYFRSMNINIFISRKNISITYNLFHRICYLERTSIMFFSCSMCSKKILSYFIFLRPETVIGRIGFPRYKNCCWIFSQQKSCWNDHNGVIHLEHLMIRYLDYEGRNCVMDHILCVYDANLFFRILPIQKKGKLFIIHIL